jgi:hypothetical protein
VESRIAIMTLAAGSQVLAGCAHTADPALDAFEANLAAHASATEALRKWCKVRGIASADLITARFVPGADAPPPPGLRAALAVSADEPLGYRHVQLLCGDTVLSQAHNWFVPARLSPEMNRQLAETDAPFGRVAAVLGFTREPIASARRGDPACPVGAISTHRALLRLPDGRGLAMVVECYAEANLAAPTG